MPARPSCRTRWPLAACLLALPCVAAPPVATFMKYPRFQTVTISPGGNYVALTQRTAEAEALVIAHYPGYAVSKITNFGKLTDIDQIAWANDTRLLIQPARRFPGLLAGNAATGEILGMDADGKKAELLFGYQAGSGRVGTRTPQRQSTYAAGEILGFRAGDPDNVLIQTRTPQGQYNSVLRMNVRTGMLSTLARSPLPGGTFVLDSSSKVRFVYEEDEHGDLQLFRRQDADDSWQRISTYAARQGAAIPIDDRSADEFLAIDNTTTATESVVAWNLATGNKQTLFNNPVSDTFTYARDEQRHVWMFGYRDHFPKYWYPDPEHPLARLHRALRSIYPDAVISISSTTRDMALAVASVSAPQLPPTFLLLDVKNQKILDQLAAYPDLHKEDLAPTEPVELRARDGMALRGFITTPNGPRQKKNLPMVVVVHGGPHGPYDAYEFDPEVQLLASRGYAVLQVNFRGSGGQGRVFEAAGYGRWGREMQDDVTDAVRWAIADGVADRNRICILGGSYGAYAALTGAFREPDLFKCAVGIAGVYDLPLLFEQGDISEHERGLSYLKAVLGTDQAELKARSPAYNADKIRIPVMLIHGKDDERAPIAHAERMRAALEKAGNKPEWLTRWGEGHGFNDETNRITMYEKVLDFLARHIGGDSP